MWLLLLCVLPVLYIYRAKVIQILLPLVLPYVLEYLTRDTGTRDVSEQELGDAEVSGRLLKIPFRFNGQKYVFWTTYNRRAKAGTKVYAHRNGVNEDLEWCPWIPVSISTIELKCDFLDVVAPNEDEI